MMRGRLRHPCSIQQVVLWQCASVLTACASVTPAWGVSEFVLVTEQGASVRVFCDNAVY